MIKSMTGYGRATCVFEGAEYTVELKSVNNRYLDLSVKLPRSFSALEDRLKKHLTAAISRGKVDVFCSVQSLSGTSTQISLDEGLTEQYLDALHLLRDKFGLKDDISVTTIARNSEIFIHRIPEENEDQTWERLKTVTDSALSSFQAMRETEGKALEADFEEKLATIESFVSDIEAKAPETVRLYEERLTQKLTELLGASFDDSRLLTEVALLSDRVSVDEELTRLKSHIAQFRSILKENVPVGRKLDFLTQELNRETNTIGSKCARLEISNTVIALKNELEKIREQIQNVE